MANIVFVSCGNAMNCSRTLINEIGTQCFNAWSVSEQPEIVNVYCGNAMMFSSTCINEIVTKCFNEFPVPEQRENSVDGSDRDSARGRETHYGDGFSSVGSCSPSDSSNGHTPYRRHENGFDGVPSGNGCRYPLGGAYGSEVLKTRSHNYNHCSSKSGNGRRS